MATPISRAAVSSIPLSGNALVDSLLYGTKWGAGVGASAVVSFSFPDATSSWSTDPFGGYGSSAEPRTLFAPLNSVEQGAFASALQAWANVANIGLVPSVDNALAVGDIRVAYTAAFSSPYILASTYLPSASPKAGDVWLNIADRSSYVADVSAGSLGFHTLVHELGHAIGLKHPFAAAGISSALLRADLDNVAHTQMSYSEKPGLPDDGRMSMYPTTPMQLDIAAAQYLYGPNLSYHAGNDVYLFTENGRYFQTIWDAGGNDTIQYSATSHGLIDLRPDAWSILGQPIRYSDGTSRPYTAAIYSTVTIENAIGGDGSDTLIGNSAANQLSGGRGNDVLIGLAGSDVLDGGFGDDIANYSGARSGYSIVWSDGATVSSAVEGSDHLTGVEALQFPDATEHIIDRPLEYIASYPDLMRAFGANAAAGFAHYLNAGHREGRTIPFDGLEYIASYSDLILAFGADAEAGAGHYVRHGRFEGRHTTFDGLEYIASYPDLISAFRIQETAHAGPDVGTTHYIDAGYAEHRSTTLFDPGQYLANYADLQAAFGNDTQAATVHYITVGYFEGRTDHPLA